MISAQSTVVLERAVLRVARLDHNGRQTTVASSGAPHVYAVRVGLQGPVGTVAEDVLTRAAAAEQAATEAASVAGQAATDLNKLVTDLNNAFAYHAGVISAQGG